jgi:hypothetical protein
VAPEFCNFCLQKLTDYCIKKILDVSDWERAFCVPNSMKEKPLYQVITNVLKIIW